MISWEESKMTDPPGAGTFFISICIYSGHLYTHFLVCFSFLSYVFI